MAPVLSSVLPASAGRGSSFLIAGRSGITPEMAVKLEKAIGSTADTWLRMQMNYDLAQVRKRTINVKRLVPV
ncbi:MAG TPA: HigA family addiction module antitoxin [Terriglobales bacterium]|jgi:addiction module HigA family antidote|nr:HigA family addiction module antitoxin [Terriglobales bacterium]